MRKTAVLPLLALLAAPAWAALGEYESSVSVDQRALRGIDVSQARSGYRIHQITAPDGSAVQEFVSPEGVVFGIAWQSLHMPNLQQLMGSSLTELQVALQSRTPRAAGRGPLIVQTPNMVFVSAGHMRAFHGHAYLRALVPAGVDPEAMQ